MALGIDYAWGRPSPTVIASAGYEFVCRYVSHDTTGKNLTALEAIALGNAGLSLVIVFESGASRMLGGFDAGAVDAKFAAAEAVKLGMPSDRPIYFACDFEAAESQQVPINAYLNGVASVITRNRTGMYGPYGPVKRAFDAGKIAWGWQTYAWSGGLWDPRAQIQQYSNEHLLDGVDVDYDRAMTEDYGQWRIGNMTINKADLDAIAVAVLNKDGIIPSLDPSDPNKYRALRTHVYELGVNVAEIRKIVSAVTPAPADQDAIIAGVIAGLNDRIIGAVSAGFTPEIIDVIANKVAENLARRMAS